MTPYLTTAKWQRSGIPADAVLPESVEMLWGSPFATMKISDGGKTITIKTGEFEGRSLIAIKDSDDPKGLGDNCYFQWGRKDPLLSDASQLGNVYHGLENSIQNPSNFIKGAKSAWDWFCGASIENQDATLWGGESGRKTVWDPCPQGYRVPSEAEIADITYDPVPVYFYTSENGFPELGLLARNESDGEDLSVVFDYNHRSYWTRHVYGENASGLVINYNEGEPDDVDFEGFVRDQGLPLRCVRE